jgi:hypothetical protein
MYKCDEGHVFEEHKTYIEPHEEELRCCPVCGSEDYEMAFNCFVCGKWMRIHDIRKNICYECAEGKYTNRLGLKFIDKHKRDFFLGCLNGIDKMYKEKEDDLIAIIEKDFLEHIDMDTDWNGNLKEVKNFCMEDVDLWIDFLEEEI